MVNMTGIFNIAVTPKTTIALIFEDKFDVFCGMRSLATNLKSASAMILFHVFFWIVESPLFSALTVFLSTVVILLSPFLQSSLMVFPLTNQGFLYQIFAMLIVVVHNSFFSNIGASISHILFLVTLILCGFLLFDFPRIGVTIFLSAFSARVIKTIFTSGRTVEKFWSGWKFLPALCANLCLVIHSSSRLLSRLLLASDDASDRFSGATLDALRIIPLIGERSK